ncbi:MAG: 2OG-Fe(II) oxygenase [Pirellulaceae bacterium]
MLQRTTVAEGIWTVDDFFTSGECQHHIQWSEEQGYLPATVGQGEAKGYAPGIRNNYRVIAENQELADLIWERGRSVIPQFVQAYEVVGINELFRFYRYEQGQCFHRHADGFHRRENGERSRLTLLIYLNDGFDGGETRFDNAIVTPREGQALLFIHGLLHEGVEVFNGYKYVLRTDVMYSANPLDLDEE